MHSSLDGFVAGPNREMDWIKINESMFDFVATMTANADTALYGRVTYEMMQAYWPTAGDKPNASKHDKEHAAWYNKVDKIILSTTLVENELFNTIVIRDAITEKINAIKSKVGKNILIIGSPRASHSLLNLGLIDEFWIFINPVLLGQGIPLFKEISTITKLKLVDTKIFNSGVVAVHYQKIQ